MPPTSGRTATHATVPHFALYGEAAVTPDAGFIHIEDIRSRSHLYDWGIDTHTHKGLFQLLVVLQGQAEVRLDDLKATVSGPCAVLVPPATVHSFQFTPGTQGYVLTVAEAVLFDGAGGPGQTYLEGLFRAPATFNLSDDPASLGRISGLLDQVMAEFRWPQPGHAPMCEWLVRALLLLIERQRAAGGPSAPDQRRTELFARFRTLVEEHFTEHWTLPRYADALGITQSRLNRLCRQLVDRSAFDVVQDRLLLEARRRLIYIAAPVAMIGYELGFQDPAYFNRLFKKLTGETPAAFRRRARGEEEVR